MIRFFIMLVIITNLVFLGCNKEQNTQVDTTADNSQVDNNQRKNDVSADSTPTQKIIIPKSTFGNVRMAILNKRQNIIFVHKHNDQYLRLSEEAQEGTYEDVTLANFEYVAKTLPHRLKNSVIILEEELMKQLLDFSKKQVNFFSHATKISYKDLTQEDWPPEESLLIEHNNNLYLLPRPRNMRSGKGQAYRTMKYNLFLAQGPGYSVRIIQTHKENNVRKSRIK